MMHLISNRLRKDAELNCAIIPSMQIKQRKYSYIQPLSRDLTGTSTSRLRKCGVDVSH